MEKVGTDGMGAERALNVENKADRQLGWMKEKKEERKRTSLSRLI